MGIRRIGVEKVIKDPRQSQIEKKVALEFEIGMLKNYSFVFKSRMGTPSVSSTSDTLLVWDWPSLGTPC